MIFIKQNLLYENPLAKPADIETFRAEGHPAITFPRGRMRLENAREPDDSTHEPGAFLFWCPVEFPDNISVTWDFRPLTDAGLAMFWISATGREGEDLFDAALARRNGTYGQYHHGDINALHVSYFRRNPKEMGFRTCNLRKSHGFHLVCQAGDPIPDVKYAQPSYRVEVVKYGPHVRFSMDGIPLFHWVDDGQNYGAVLGGGKIGFRQMPGLIGEYSNLQVHSVEKE